MEMVVITAPDGFREVSVAPDYWVNEGGEIWSEKSHKLLRTKVRKQDGYISVKLNGCDFMVHRIVAEVFVPNPDNKPVVHHRDHNRSNCHASNLAWVTTDENGDLAIQDPNSGYYNLNPGVKYFKIVNGAQIPYTEEDYAALRHNLDARKKKLIEEGYHPPPDDICSSSIGGLPYSCCVCGQVRCKVRRFAYVPAAHRTEFPQIFPDGKGLPCGIAREKGEEGDFTRHNETWLVIRSMLQLLCSQGCHANTLILRCKSFFQCFVGAVGLGDLAWFVAPPLAIHDGTFLSSRLEEYLSSQGFALDDKSDSLYSQHVSICDGFRAFEEVAGSALEIFSTISGIMIEDLPSNLKYELKIRGI